MHATLRLLTLPALALLTACAHQSGTLELKKDRQCPLTLNKGQQLILSLPSNPTTGYRWAIQDSAGGVLKSLGPEVYQNPDNSGLVGSGGQSTWRFQAFAAGTGRLRLTYQQPWEPEAVPAQSFDCPIVVN